MAILSSFSLIRGLSIFHLTLAYFLLTSPQTLNSQNIVVLLGEAMHLPAATSFDGPSPACALAAILFALLGFSDLVAVSMNEVAALHYWAAQAPVRVFFMFALTIYAYVFKPQPVSMRLLLPNPVDNLKTGLVFTWAFLEGAVWFLVYLSLRDERKSIVSRHVERRRQDED